MWIDFNVTEFKNDWVFILVIENWIKYNRVYIYKNSSCVLLYVNRAQCNRIELNIK